jgi:hypothetical protein
MRDRLVPVENGGAMKSSRIALTVRGKARLGRALPPAWGGGAAAGRCIAQGLSCRAPAGGAHMRKIWMVLIAVLLGSTVGACSKCEIPDLLPKICKTGASGT